ncbi:MAG TPA: NucA/NucB deoxyribonuclease domain-containing protein, partial [Ferruginibacter sp.]|nr:NucA/NucB deoxyribonuclease domain-containing protein [Ferruginibacter sp.]
VLTRNGGGAEKRSNRYYSLKDHDDCEDTKIESRDEFPYASTMEGGTSQAAVRCVLIKEQEIQRLQLIELYKLVNKYEKFLVVPIDNDGEPSWVPSPVPQTKPINVPLPVIINLLERVAIEL